jgi:hypothetical protein
MKLTEYIDERRLARLPEGTPRQKVETMLDRPDADAYIKAVDAPVLFQLIKDAGWEDAQPLMAHVSTEQLQTFVDLDCWRKDRFQPDKLRPWLAAILAEADDVTFKRHCRDVDAEVLAMFFKSTLRVDLMGEEGEVPEQFWDENVEVSPDGVYALVYPEDEATAVLLRQTVDRLYEVDRVLAWTLLEAVRWELMSPMEEEAFRWRRSRLEEYGFVEFDEAMKIYKPLDPLRFRERIEAGEIEEKLAVEPQDNLPILPSVPEEERFYAAAVIKGLEGDALQSAMAEFVALHNRALIAEGIEPGASAEADAVTERTTGYLSIGLEYLSRRNDEVAAELVRTIPLRDIFRVGFTTVEKLRDNVARIRRRPALTIIEGERWSLLREEDAALCEAILRPRPMFALSPTEHEIFHTQSQVDEAALKLGLIAFKQLWLFGVKQIAPGELVQFAYGDVWLNEAPDVTFDAFFASELAAVLLGRDPDRFGIRPDELEKLPARLREKPWGDDPVGFFEPIVGPVLEQLPAGTRLVTRWLEQTLDRLVDELGGVQEIENPAIFTPVLILQA